MHDVIIAGGGPTGLYAARLCKKLGIDYLVLEEHREAGRPNHCSGLISTKLEKFVEMDRSFIEHEVRGCILHSGHSSVRLTKPKTAAYVIDRERLDRHLSRNLDIRFNTRVEDFFVYGSRVTVKTNKGDVDAKLLLACDGASSLIRRKLGRKPKEMLAGVIGITRESSFSDYVEMWFDWNELRDGFFWKIPRGRTTEYGMLGRDACFDRMERFFGIKDYKKRAGAIALGLVKSYSERVLLLGDAACQVKPWSGGGVIYGLKCAEVAMETIREALEANDFSGRFLSRYESRWRKAIGRQIGLGMLYRKLYRKAGKKAGLALSVMKLIPMLNRLDMDLL